MNDAEETDTDAVTIENLTDLRERLAGVWEHASHLTLLEVLDRNQTEQLARLELRSSEIEPFIPATDDTRDETQVEALARGAAAWVRATVVQQMYGRSTATFKLMVWAPKGAKCLLARRFGAVSSAFDDPPIELPKPSEPSFQGEGAPDWMLRRVKNYLAVVESSTAWLLQSSRAIAADQAAYIRRLETRLGQLIDALVSGDRHTGALVKQVTMDVEQARLRAELSKSTIEQIGKVTSSLVAGWNKIDPELMEVLADIQDDAELMATLRNPKVRAFLKDASARKALSGILSKFATAYAEPAEPAPAAPAAPAAPPSADSPPPKEK